MLNKKTKLIFFIFIIFFSFLNLENVFASECEDKCETVYLADENACEKCEDNCKDLEKKAKAYEEIIEVKNKQQDTLDNQLTYINRQQSENQKTLNETAKNIDSLSQKITTLEEDIKQKEKEIAYQKKMLSVLMQSYYDYDQQGILEIVLLNETLKKPFEQTDYIEQSGIKVGEVLDEIKITQQKLLKDQQELKDSHEKSVELKEKLEEEKYGLELTANQKETLLAQTKNEEQKYQDLLARVEQQKLELFNFSSASNLTEISDSVKNYPTPPLKYQASTSWYFSQRDSHWRGKRIGNSSSLMKDYGCAVTSVAMVFRKNGSSTDPGKLSKEKIFYYDLIKWPASWSPRISLSSSVSHGNISWSKIDDSIDDGDPVIVYIKKTNGRGGHYIVITGYDKKKKDYVVHDPYFGANLYLGTSKALIGKIGTDSKVSIDQMIIYK